MPKVIEVRFKEHQGAEELYISSGIPKKVYIRQPRQDSKEVLWLTATKSGNGYEASSPVKVGIVMRVVVGVKKKKETLFEETVVADGTGAPYSEKVEHFACDQLRTAAKNIVTQHSLHTFESWKKWLLDERSKYRYEGCDDNWLFFGTEPGRSEVVETLNIIGVPYTVTSTPWRHMACSKTWNVLEIKDAQGNVLELCGYSYTR